MWCVSTTEMLFINGWLFTVSQTSDAESPGISSTENISCIFQFKNRQAKHDLRFSERTETVLKDAYFCHLCYVLVLYIIFLEWFGGFLGHFIN